MCIISRVSSKNKGKRAKSKNSVKKTKSKQQKKKRYKETENSVAGSRTQFICMCKQLLDHWTTVTWKISLVISKPFLSLPKTWKTLFEAGGAVFIINSNNYTFLGKLA